MSEFVKIGTLAEMPEEGEAKEFSAGANVVCVARTGGELCALDNVCLHRGGPLGGGVVDGPKIICPWHGWTFGLKSGEATHSAAAKVRTYPLRVAGENVEVEV
jgi:nitrite reductase (NADH) small subunit